MRLQIELVPASTWTLNVRSLVPTKEWDRLKRRTFQAAGYRCEICGERGPHWPVECHEIWTYDEQHRVQRLTGLIALCPRCHQAKHYGFAVSQGRGEEAVQQLMRVNRLDRATTIAHIEAALAEWNIRSQVPWEVDISWLHS